jgi:hypothetical protein
MIHKWLISYMTTAKYSVRCPPHTIATDRFCGGRKLGATPIPLI